MEVSLIKKKNPKLHFGIQFYYAVTHICSLQVFMWPEMFSKTNVYILVLFVSGSGHNMALDYRPGFSEVISEGLCWDPILC